MTTTLPGRPAMVRGLRLVRPVGSGGEGEVWEARDARGRRRALKLVRPEALAGPEEVARRGEQLRRIDHAALVRVHDSGLLFTPGLEGWGFLEMDYVDGESLAQARPDRGWFERLEPLAEALDLLHAGAWSDGVPLVHRDVKPANLVESSADGRIVLVDCSSLRGADTTQLTRIGTPVFAAPEVVTGRFGPAADVYSFAATVVALVTGERGRDLLELLNEPWSLDVPDELCRALSAQAQERPASCLSVLGAASEQWLPPESREYDEDRWLPVETAEVFVGEGVGDRVPQPVALHGAAVPAPHGQERRGPVSQHDPAAPALHDPAAGDAPARRVWPWLVSLAGLAVIASGLLAAPGLLAPSPGGRLAADPLLWTGLLGVHLLLHVAARRRLLPAILLPPVSWAYLLAARSAPPGRRRTWAEIALTGAMAGPALVALLVVADPGMADRGVADRSTVAASLLAAVALATVVTVSCRTAVGAGLRLLLLPVWAVGALVTLAGAVVALPVTLLAGRPGVALRLAGRALGSVTGAGPQREVAVPSAPVPGGA